MLLSSFEYSGKFLSSVLTSGFTSLSYRRFFRLSEHCTKWLGGIATENLAIILDLNLEFFYDRINYSFVSNLFTLAIVSSMFMKDWNTFILSLWSKFCISETEILFLFLNLPSLLICSIFESISTWPSSRFFRCVCTYSDSKMVPSIASLYDLVSTSAASSKYLDYLEPN